jgi:hypothetical protein
MVFRAIARILTPLIAIIEFLNPFKVKEKDVVLPEIGTRIHGAKRLYMKGHNSQQTSPKEQSGRM